MSKKYQHFDKNELIAKVVKNGNSAKVNCPKQWINKKVLIQIIQ